MKGIRLSGAPLYLDMQATTPLDPRVLDTMLPYMTELYGNPHSRTHLYGWETEDAVEVARKQARLPLYIVYWNKSGYLQPLLGTEVCHGGGAQAGALTALYCYWNKSGYLQPLLGTEVCFSLCCAQMLASGWSLLVTLNLSTVGR